MEGEAAKKRENLDKFDPELLDDEGDFSEDEDDVLDAEEAMKKRDEREAARRQRSKVQSAPAPDPVPDPQIDRTDSKKQTSLFSFFSKKTKSPGLKGDAPPVDTVSVSVSVLKAQAEAEALTPLVSKIKSRTGKGAGTRAPGSLVWAKLTGYPWWPALVCNHPTEDEVERKSQGQVEIHVQFLGEPFRDWVSASLVRPWGTEVDRTQGEKDSAWRAGVKEAEEAAELSDEERIALLLREEQASTVEEGSGEEGEESEEEEVKKMKPAKKRRRIVMMDSDSDNEEEKKKKTVEKEYEEEKEEEEEAYEVETILEKKEEGGVTKYLIQWLGYDKEEDRTWEPEANLDCAEKIRLFEEALGGKKQVEERREKDGKELVKDESEELSAGAC